MTVPPMASSLVSRHSTLASMAVGAYWAIRLEGLRMPVRRVIAEMAQISEATLSRRFAGVSAEDALVLELVRARGRSYPRLVGHVPYPQWIAESQEEVDDVCVWSACEQLAVTSPTLGQAIREVWGEQRRRLAVATSSDARTVTALHALITGLDRRRMLDEGFSHDDAASVLRYVAEALEAAGSRGTMCAGGDCGR